MLIHSCVGAELAWKHPESVDDETRLVWHLLDTAPSMSGGPMWCFLDNKRVVWGLHEGAIDATNKRAILFNKSVLGQIARWISKGLTAR